MFTALPSAPPISLCVWNAGGLLNLRDSRKMNAVPWDVAQGKGVCAWLELSSGITTLSQPGVFSVS